MGLTSSVKQCFVILIFYQWYMISTWIITVKVDFDLLAEVVFKCLHCKIIIFLSHSILCSLAGNHYEGATLKRLGIYVLPPWMGYIYINYLEILGMGNLPSPIYLFFSITYLYKYRLMNSLVIIQYCYIYCCANYILKVSWEFFQLPPVSVW